MRVATGMLTQVEFGKWPDTLHWHYEVQELGEDEHGRWLCIHAGTLASGRWRGPEAASSGRQYCRSSDWSRLIRIS
jgi:hypothetical protein